MRNKSRHRITKKKKVLITILSLLLCIILIGGIYSYIELNKVKSGSLSNSNSDLGITNSVDAELKAKDVTNIALFGVDSRDTGSDVGSRSDSIMILSIDKEHNKLKLTSIMRDTYVNVDGHGKTKITHAYAYGGPKLAVKTINENFNMNIKDYATVDFFGLEKIINAIGGVQINVEKAEVTEINGGVAGTATIEKVAPTFISNAGLQTLNGIQAVAYARIRHVGNGDYERTERQRAVLEQVIKKITSRGVMKLPSLLNTMLPYVETSMSKTDIIATGTTVLTKGMTSVQQLRLPEDGYCKGEMINKIYYLVADLDVARAHLYKFIYEEEMPKTN